MLSDLHCEFNPKEIDKLFDTSVDLIILAGDISNSTYIKEDLTYISNIGIPIIYITGNHEYYGSSKKELDKELTRFCKSVPNLTFLNNQILQINDIVFIGSTGWCDESNGLLTQYHYKMLNDFRYIEDSGELTDWGRANKIFFEEQLEELSKYKDKKVICISHNGPTTLSPPEFKNHPLNTCFQNKWEDMILKYQPLYWLFGHTHKYMKYEVDKTICICNPVGYPTEKTNYKKTIIEV